MAAQGMTVALVVAAGSGSRAGRCDDNALAPKQFRRIGGRPMLAHALDHLEHPGIDAVQVVIGEGQQAEFRDAVGDRPLLPPVIGGASRQQSVRNGLAALAGDAGQVLIHDAARPFLPVGVIDRLLGALDSHCGAVPVLPVVDTLAHGGAGLGETLPRDGLVRVQTPQAFRYEDIVRAHHQWRGDAASDDAQVARAAGLDIALVEGDVRLDKLTYDEDFRRAERLLDRRMTARTGQGFDVHAFAGGDGVWLGGVRIAYARGLAGHSDADVALHALTDAVLGAIGAGDIGDHFPPSDPKWHGADSGQFLSHAARLVQGGGGRIVHCDITIICEAPKVGPHREAMRQRIADLLGLAVARVSVKATTTERLGFTGRGEGIAAQAIATVEMPEDR